MPPRSIKVVKLMELEQPPTQDTLTYSDDAHEISPINEVKSESDEPSEKEAVKDTDSDDLEELVKEYQKEKRQKQKANEPRATCQHCDKEMSMKSLRYSHQKNCKKDPINSPPPPPPPPTPVEPVRMKSRSPRKKATVKKEEVIAYKIEEPVKEEIKEPLTTNYVRLAEQQRSARITQKSQRMKKLASQAF